MGWRAMMRGSVAAALLSCGEPSGGDPAATTTGTTAPSTSAVTIGDTTRADTTGLGSSTSTTTGMPIFDVGAPDAAAGTEGEMGCRSIDFLFVIDNSGSMAEQQARLLDSFGGFIQAIQASLVGVQSVHVGVMTSDAYVHNEAPCNVLGGLVTQTGGPSSSNQTCIFSKLLLDSLNKLVMIGDHLLQNT